jgi:hypothetical protein
VNGGGLTGSPTELGGQRSTIMSVCWAEAREDKTHFKLDHRITLQSKGCQLGGRRTKDSRTYLWTSLPFHSTRSDGGRTAQAIRTYPSFAGQCQSIWFPWLPLPFILEGCHDAKERHSITARLGAANMDVLSRAE